MTASLTERLCNLCGIVKPFSEFHKRSASKNGVRSYCKQCEKNYSQNNKEKIQIRVRSQRENNLSYAAYQRQYCNTIRGRASRILAGARRRAKEKNLKFEINIADVIKLLELGKCQQTNISFIIDENYHPFAPSLDRKDSAKDYTLDNVQMVCVAYNLGKQHMTDDQYKTFIVQAAKFIQASNP